MSAEFDLLVVGGGINGVGIARDAAGRGLKVLLVEQGDLASATSSASSKMIHGGLRYLEHGAFRLVREGLAEREVLLRMAPHLVRPLRLVLPLGAGSRPRWMLRTGLYLYDRLGGARTLPASAAVDLRTSEYGAPLRTGVRHGFVYADCSTDDARLTIVSARDAVQRGAEIAPRSQFVSASRDEEQWRCRIAAGGRIREATARAVVNAAGPWVPDVAARCGLAGSRKLRLVKGSHIVVPKLYDGEHGYLLQNDDRRIVFVLPFERAYSLVGTTELPFAGDPAKSAITPEEVTYLCRAVSHWFAAPPRPEDAVWSYAGVRPLYDDRARSAAAISRDYVFDLDTKGAPAMSVLGGKLTTYRRLAEAVLTRLARYLPGMSLPWTAASVLPGGEGIPRGGPAELADGFLRHWPLLGEATAMRLALSYGSEVPHIFAEGAGRDFGAGLYEAELRWLTEHEWAQTADDVLWRRSKLGLHMAPAQIAELGRYLGSRQNLRAAAPLSSA